MSDFDFDVPIPDSQRGSYAGKDKHGVKNFPLNGSKFFPANAKANPYANVVRMNEKTCKFTSRKVTENGVTGIRVWRIA